MLATQHIPFAEYTKPSIDIIEEKELETDPQYICHRRRDRRAFCLRCDTLSKQCNNLKQKLDKSTNELESVTKNCIYNSLPRRQNTTPITVLLSIENDKTITNDIYDILDKELTLVTQCSILLHKNHNLLNNQLSKIKQLQPQHITAIKCAINNYYEISQCINNLQFVSKQDEFKFYIIWYSISICGRIQHVVTKEYWKCVNYLTTFIDLIEEFNNFDTYISRFIPLKLPGSIIEDVCREYKLYNHDQFSTLKDVISSWANKTVSQVSELNNNNTEVDIIFDDNIEIIEDIIPESNDECMNNYLDSLHMTLTSNDQTHQSVENINDSVQTLNAHAADFVPCNNLNVLASTNNTTQNVINIPILAAISEDIETPMIEQNILSPTIQTIVTCDTETKTDEINIKNECKYNNHKIRGNNNNINKIRQNKAENRFFIAKEMISKINKKCVEEFNINELNDERLLFDYIKNSISMQNYDKQINNQIKTNFGLIIILNIDLHFDDYQTMYLIAIENDISFRDSMKWQVINFMRSYQICNEYNINSHQLPESSRSRAPFRYGINTPPNHVPISILRTTKLKQLPGKESKKRVANESVSKLRISENDLKYWCQQSWYNNLMLPVVVIKGKKQWIEWKKFIRIMDDKYGNQQWIGISLRYYRCNKQWKIECIEYDIGRVYYQHRLIGNCDIDNRYKYSYNQLPKLINTFENNETNNKTFIRQVLDIY